jgi:hypothetical protein
MALHSSQFSKSKLNLSDVVLQTNTHRWVIPYNCEILKALIAEKNIKANDLHFRSTDHCHQFIKRLLLLAAADECRNCQPSQIAVLARDMIFHKDLQTNTNRELLNI